MAVTIGQQLGSYEITALLGKGGMGEVYRARDSKLKRDVAIKILPEEFSCDTDRVARFQREAEVLAALNHPNIAAIYDLQHENQTRFLVLELVEGETLAERIARGAVPVDEALNIAKNICEALETAHERGIIHRDLKPANIKLTPDGKVKVLDFGLAKAMEAAPSGTGLSNSPTLVNSFGATNAGVIIGTASYMSPEQARGRTADQRSDIFAFGCVLYEMLTGHQAFQGETVSDILASVLAREADFSLLPSDLSPRPLHFLRRCLEKNRKGRWHCVGDLRAELESIAAEPPAAPLSSQLTPVSKPLWKRAIPIAISTIVFGAMTGIAVWRFKPSNPRPVARFSFSIPGNEPLISHSVGISPDGSQVAYVANKRLYLRSISEGDARPIPGTDAEGLALAYPVFSPDGASLVFTDIAGPAGGTIKKIAVTGGVAVKLLDAYPLGLSWDANGIALCSAGPGIGRILRVSPNGGKPSPMLDSKDSYLKDPQMLPGGQALIFSIAANIGEWYKGRIVVQSLKSGERKTLIEEGTSPRYVPTGHVVYALGGTLFAVPFDANRLELTGGPVPVVEGVWRTFDGTSEFSISDNGSLVYIPGPASTQGTPQQSIGLIERTGQIKSLGLPPGPYSYPRVAPNGKSIAFETDNGKEAIIYVYDLSGGTSMRRLTFGGANRFPIWSSDSQHVAFQSDRDGDLAIFWQRADGTGNTERLTKPEKGAAHIPDSWSPDGQRFSFTEIKGEERAVWTFSVTDKKAQLFAGVPSSRLGSSAFSPDGKWLAYHSDETKRFEIFVQPFPPNGTKYQVSKDAQSHNPVWSPDGKELFYIPGPNQFLKINLTTAPSFTFSNPAPVSSGGFVEYGPPGPRTYDITPDGKRFVGVVAASTAETGAREIHVVLNWLEELKQRVPVK